MNRITEALLKTVSDWKGNFKGAYNIRDAGHRKISGSSLKRMDQDWSSTSARIHVGRLYIYQPV